MMNYYNFAAGPACLPASVLQRVQQEIFTPDKGVTLLEYPHRTPKIQQLAEDVLAAIRMALQVPDTFEIILLSGGARLLYGSIPLNLLREGSAVYGVSGHWSNMAYEEAKRIAPVTLAFNSDVHRSSVPDLHTWQIPAESRYCHLVDNETIDGLCLPHDLPDFGVPYVLDMTSSLGMLPLDYPRYGLIYAGAQKALGISGLTIVIIRKDWLSLPAHPLCPTPLQFQAMAAQRSLMITPPTFAWVASKWMCHWIAEQGGIDYFYRRNQRWAAQLYDLIDSMPCYHNAVDPRYRSQINIIFELKDKGWNEQFCEEAAKLGLLYVKGHLHKGGIRISLYPAMTEAGFNAICAFMQTFSKVAPQHAR
jgi:phosphoserine aminotransferase